MVKSIRRTTMVGVAVALMLAVALTAAPAAMALPASVLRVDNNIPAGIPDNGYVDIPFVVSGASDTVSAVRVSVYVTHAWVSDVVISLIAPDGTTRVLASRLGTNGDNYGSGSSDSNRTTFDDAASTPIASGAPPYVGSFRPGEALSAFNGTSPNGTWTLRIADADPIIVGAFQAGSLFFEVAGADVTAPVITAPSDITAEATGPDGATVSFSASAVDAVDGPVTCLANPASGSTFPIGSTTVQLSAQDAAGNTSYSSFTVDVVDTTAPVITVPSDITAEAAGPGGAVVDFASLCSASDIVDGAVACSFSPASGSTFPMGGTQVEVSAQDAAGNVTYDYFTINVGDTTAPDVAANGDVVVSATSAWGAWVDFGTSASDAVDGSLGLRYWLDWGTPYESEIMSPYQFPHGTSTVTCVAVDAAGNTGTTTFDVTVSWANLIQQAIDQLNAMLPTLRSTTDRAQVNEALGHLRKALSTSLWHDGSQPIAGAFAGELVFVECKAAIEHLRRTGVANSLMGVPVSKLVNACRGIAELKIYQAEMWGGNATKLRAARAAMVRANQLVATSPHLAIDFYKEAWKQAMGSLSVSR